MQRFAVLGELQLTNMHNKEQERKKEVNETEEETEFFFNAGELGYRSASARAWPRVLLAESEG